MAGRKQRSLGGLKDTAGGVKRSDRYSLAKGNFEPISIDAENAKTVVYMLQSPESGVVLRAVASLERFGKKGVENLELLHSFEIIKYVLPLVRHEDYLIRRFAQKLIAELCSLDKFRENIFAEEGALEMFAEILQKEDDVVMHEFASLTLAELSSECLAAAKILQIAGCAETLHSRLSSPDPDVQKNCLDTMKNLLNEIDGVQYFMCLPGFDLKPILDLTSSDYPVIQMSALEVIQQFMSWSMDNRIICSFRDSSGPDVMVGIVENLEWTELHVPALDVMLKVADNPIICEYLRTSGCLHRVVLLLDLFTDAVYLEKILGILARISQTDEGRKALHTSNMGQIFGEYLQSDWSAVLEPVCLGVANMAQYAGALDSIMVTEPTAHLLDIITDNSREWKLRESAAYALNTLSHEIYKVSEDLLEEGRFERLLPLLSVGADVPVEVVLNIIQIFIRISASEKCRRAVISENLIKLIMSLIQDAHEPYLKPARLQILAMECLSGFLLEDIGRSSFQALGGTQKLIGCLKNRYASLRQWAALLVTQMSQNLDFVKAFIRHHGLKWMIDKKEMRYSAPSWESAIEAIFRAYLPAKFAIKGRLDMHDFTQEGFFVLRHHKKTFFILDDLLEVRASPAYPVYVANFIMGASPCNFDDRATESSYPSTKLDDEKEKKDSGTWSGSRPYSHKTDGTGDRAYLDTFAACPNDPYLPEYLNKLRRKLLRDTDICFRDPQWLSIHPRLIRQRAQILARFVADEMSGPDPDPVCKDHYLEMHINDVRVSSAFFWK
ncbi:UNVERIFIED_CONTAM: hypothetical protein PYX00_000084 [Menopon gallinae]|uniref:Uncharacterized protein n=1 Tax=Menopon gallinae TaxID=328185 RepID=A0AAW2I767_9NEOP